VRGQNHPPTPAGQVAMSVAQVAQVLGTAFVFMGEQLLNMARVPRTPFVQNVLDNKIQVLGSSFLLSSVAQSIAKTDAFEVYVNGELVFSKLEKKRMPTVDEIFRALADRGVATPIGGGEITRQTSSRSQQM